MKRWIVMAMLMLGIYAPVLADQPGIYNEVCRRDDPFVYCTQGCKETKAWKPLSVPGKGYANAGYKPQIGYCPYPTTVCCDQYCVLRPWSQEEYQDYWEHRVVICPKAHEEGDWEPYNGQGAPEDEPESH